MRTEGGEGRIESQQFSDFCPFKNIISWREGNQGTPKLISFPPSPNLGFAKGGKSLEKEERKVIPSKSERKTRGILEVEEGHPLTNGMIDYKRMTQRIPG